MLGQLVLFFGLQPLLDLVLEVVLGSAKLVLGEVHHLGFKLLEEPSCGKFGLDGLSLSLYKSV